MSGIEHPPSQREISEALQARMKRRVEAMSEQRLHDFLADAVYLERKRSQDAKEMPGDREQQALDDAAHAIREGHSQMAMAALGLVRLYAYEIHNVFSSRTYEVAAKVLPGALSKLLTAADGVMDLAHGFDPKDRVVVSGQVDLVQRLAKDHTLILAPTHVSNLDSPLVGYALMQVGLPPFIYGAGLNLFSNPAMSFFMSRLGAYTVDCRKRHGLYKHVLKDYSVEALTRQTHSLFYPGGTRSRSGMIEKRVKRGLLGTGIVAWQEGLAKDPDAPSVLIVPCTLSCSLVLEAETLIEDSLALEGKARYIITDDEFAQPGEVASFTSRVLQMDASVHVRLGRPLDCVGNPVGDDGLSLDPGGRSIDRRQYVTDREGAVVWDGQRDKVYTDRLAESLVDAYHRDNTVLSTHLAGFAAWQLLRRRHPSLDTFHRVLLAPGDCRVPRADLLKWVGALHSRIVEMTEQGLIHHALPATPEQTLDRAIDRFSRFHKVRGLERRGDQVVIAPKLALYYGNRLVGYDLEGVQ